MFEGLRLVHWKSDLRNDGILPLTSVRTIATGSRRRTRDLEYQSNW